MSLPSHPECPPQGLDLPTWRGGRRRSHRGKEGSWAFPLANGHLFTWREATISLGCSQGAPPTAKVTQVVWSVHPRSGPWNSPKGQKGPFFWGHCPFTGRQGRASSGHPPGPLGATRPESQPHHSGPGRAGSLPTRVSRARAWAGLGNPLLFLTPIPVPTQLLLPPLTLRRPQPRPRPWDTRWPRPLPPPFLVKPCC
jgi:hypothetical protein